MEFLRALWFISNQYVAQLPSHMSINSTTQGVPFLVMIRSPMGSTSRSGIIIAFGMPLSLSRASHYYPVNVRNIVVLAERILFSMLMPRWKARNELLMMTTLSMKHRRSLVLMVKTSWMAMRKPSGTKKRMRCNSLSGDQNGLSTRMKKMIACAPMVVTSALGTCPGVRRPKIRKWKMSRTMMTLLSCTQFRAGRSVIVPRQVRRLVVMMKRRHKMARLTVIASAAHFNQGNRTSLLTAANGIVSLNPQEARALSEVLISTRSEHPGRRSEARKFLWMLQRVMFQTNRRIPSARVERSVRSGNQMVFSTRLGLMASGFALLW